LERIRSFISLAEKQSLPKVLREIGKRIQSCSDQKFQEVQSLILNHREKAPEFSVLLAQQLRDRDPKVKELETQLATQKDETTLLKA